MFVRFLLCVHRQYNPNHRDLNAKAAWQSGFTGKGVVVSILDDGIEKNHPDLMQNYVSLALDVSQHKDKNITNTLDSK